MQLQYEYLAASKLYSLRQVYSSRAYLLVPGHWSPQTSTDALNQHVARPTQWLLTVAYNDAGDVQFVVMTCKRNIPVVLLSVEQLESRSTTIQILKILTWLELHVDGSWRP